MLVSKDKNNLKKNFKKTDLCIEEDGAVLNASALDEL